MNVNVAPIDGSMAGLRPGPAFTYRHIVSFEETNVVGNVYFTRHISWQGRCREMFLKQHVPQIVGEIARGLRLVTLRVSCEYFEELYALDEIEIRMRLAHLRQNRIGLDFNYVKAGGQREITAASGFQEIGCMRATDQGLAPVAVPPMILAALAPFSAGNLGGQRDLGI